MVIFRTVYKVIKHNPIKTLIISAGAGAIGCAFGVYNGKKAKRINKQALAIRDDAIKRHQDEYDNLQTSLVKLGKLEKQVVDEFSRFSDLMEKIQERPSFRKKGMMHFNIAKYSPEEIAKFSEEYQLALAGAAGAGAGAFAGFAAFGACQVIAAPAMVIGGAVICVKGAALKSKAIKNLKQAEKIRENVEEIISFYVELKSVAEEYCDDMVVFYISYVDTLNTIEKLLENKTKWKEFTKSEKTIVKNSELLTGILYEMVNIQLVEKPKTDSEIEKINRKGLKEIQHKSFRIKRDLKLEMVR